MVMVVVDQILRTVAVNVHEQNTHKIRTLGDFGEFTGNSINIL